VSGAPADEMVQRLEVVDVSSTEPECGASPGYTTDGVKEVLAAGRDLTAEQFADLILEKAREWANVVAAEDVTVVLVDYDAQTGRSVD
jgi:hypothetical protein